MSDTFDEKQIDEEKAAWEYVEAVKKGGYIFKQETEAVVAFEFGARWQHAQMQGQIAELQTQLEGCDNTRKRYFDELEAEREKARQLQIAVDKATRIIEAEREKNAELESELEELKREPYELNRDLLKSNQEYLRCLSIEQSKNAELVAALETLAVGVDPNSSRIDPQFGEVQRPFSGRTASRFAADVLGWPKQVEDGEIVAVDKESK